MPRPKKLIIKKEDTITTNILSDTDTDTGSYIKDTEYTGAESDVEDTEYTDDTCVKKPFITLVESDYITPVNGTLQDNLTSEEILNKLQEYIPLKTMEEKKVLKTMKPFKTWIKYINIKTGKFRNGGLLMKVAYPDYIMLVNLVSKITWSVQLKDNIIFVKHPKIAEREKQINEIKNELYELYIQGELKRINKN